MLVAMKPNMRQYFVSPDFLPCLVPLDQTQSQDNKQEEDSNFFVEEPNDDKENNVKLDPQEEIDYFLN